MDSTEQGAYNALAKKRDATARLLSRYQSQLRGLTAASEPSLAPAPSSEGEKVGDAELMRPNEAVFSAPAALKQETDTTRRVDRTAHFTGMRGLHSAYDTTTRFDLKLVVTEQTYKIETLTDPHTGKAVRAALDDVGPKRSNLTWGAIATVIQLVVGFAVPVNRLMQIIGHKHFSSGRMCGILQQVARSLVKVYVYLGEALADSGHLSGDDSPTKVIDLTDAIDDDDPLKELDERFGFAAERANGKGDIKTLNVSMVTGRLDAKEPKSTVHFFRTHFGYVGNLLSRMLESRKRKSGALALQGDLSSANLPAKSLRSAIDIILAGCGAHARRPYWRYRGDDPALCYYMLSAFWLLARIEQLIDVRGRTRETTLRLRQRYGRRVWELIRRRALAAVTGGETSAGRAVRWPPKSKLYEASRYILDNFAALTRYLDDPRLEFTNNARERGLRAEVYMLVSSKFRKTRRGRAALDVLRTINATCTAAGVPLADYLREVLPAGSMVADNPAHYTPYAVAQRLAARAGAAGGSNTGAA